MAQELEENIPETLELTCVARRRETTHFTGHQVSLEAPKLSVVMVGGGELFKPGKVYTVVFLPEEMVSGDGLIRASEEGPGREERAGVEDAQQADGCGRG